MSIMLTGEAGDDQPFVAGSEKASDYDPNLYLYSVSSFAPSQYSYCGRDRIYYLRFSSRFVLKDEIETRPRVSTFVSSLVNYSNTIPAPTDPDAKPPAPAARMGK